MIGVAWALSVLISFIPVQLSWHKSLRHKEDLGEMAEKCDVSLNRTYAITSSLISFYIPVSIMIVTYTRIFLIAQKQIRRISMQECTIKHVQSCQSCSKAPEEKLKSSFKRETKVLKTLSMIMGVFVCCWLPFFILNCMVPFCDPGLHNAGQIPCVNKTTFDVFVWCGWANSTLNPVVYAFNAEFRKAFSSLLGCGKLCSQNTVQTVELQAMSWCLTIVTPQPFEMLTSSVTPVCIRTLSGRKVIKTCALIQCHKWLKSLVRLNATLYMGKGLLC